MTARKPRVRELAAVVLIVGVGITLEALERLARPLARRRVDESELLEQERAAARDAQDEVEGLVDVDPYPTVEDLQEGADA